jgi:PPOX class probable F420-dependent enzyme
MTVVTAEVVEAFLTGPHPGVITTLNKDGKPHSSLVWVGEEGGEIVSAHLSNRYQKHRNLARDPRISVTITLPTINDFGLQHYLVAEGTARLTQGGGAALLQRLARVHLGPQVVYPGPEAPDGHVLRTRPLKLRGVFPWEKMGRPRGRPIGFRDGANP